MSLTAAERETVILMDDSEDVASITTYQRSMLTKLEKNPAAKKVEDYSVEGSKGAKFLVPAKLINVRRPQTVSVAERKRRSDRARLRSRSQ